jgi:hypothetical protein
MVVFIASYKMFSVLQMEGSVTGEEISPVLRCKLSLLMQVFFRHVWSFGMVPPLLIHNLKSSCLTFFLSILYSFTASNLERMVYISKLFKFFSC